ncbi:MAG: efflux RND transporter periplasmic adaptor subunit [Planctomycetota bacterium]
MATEMKNPPPVSAPAPATTPDAMQERLRNLQLSTAERRDPKGSKGSRWLLISIVLVVVVGVIGGVAAYSGYLDPPVPEVDIVVFAEGESGNIILDLSGYIVPRTRLNVAPRVGGTVVTLPIEEGSKVKKGDLLCQIDDLSFKADLLEAQAALKLAQANLRELKNGALDEEKQQAKFAHEQAKTRFEFLSQEIERAKQLLPKGGISRSEFERLQTEVREAQSNLRSQESNLRLIEGGTREERIAASEAEVERAKAHVEKAKFWYDNARIVSPIDGTVLEKNAEVGESIRPEGGIAYLCVLADLSKMEAEVDVQERDLNKIKPGHPCQVIPDAYNDRVYQAKVDRTQPIVSRQRGVVNVKVSIDQPDDYLLPEMNCRVLFLKEGSTGESAKKPTIPKSTIVKNGEMNGVYVIVGESARLRAVELGEEQGDMVEVVKGLEQGEQVIVSGNLKLEDGMKVKARAEASKDSSATETAK